jgi:hypothetical protein
MSSPLLGHAVKKLPLDLIGNARPKTEANLVRIAT